ncbi:MAG TPA: SRPBCC family protein [Acidimicrobiales bacterium]|nr:SRPBCC family protein [Acidimicrobiales bacterium]
MRAVSGSRVIAAPAHAIFGVLADPAMHPVIDGTDSVLAPTTGKNARLALGSEFGMRMRIVVPYRITNRVVEFEEGRRIAWTHIGGARWRYELEPVEGGTRVTETYDWSTTGSVYDLGLRLLGFPSRNRAGIERTLDRLAGLVAAEP